MKTLTNAVKSAVLFSTVLATSAMAQTVQIENGTLQGTTENGVQAYKGIPYAKPPVGELR